ncbi:MAG: rhodanese-like domain-containing protein [Nitrospiraceae bacterium]|nr:MAG: rhodanese-like domain-containing protein [Nitrospiraceae bacterium]
MKKVLVVLLVMSLCLIAGQTMAAKVMTPESLDGATVVDAEWVKQNEGKVMVFDARKKGEYVEGHIPGAISVPCKEKSEKSVDFDPSKDKWDMSKYPSDKNASIVVYCNGVKCWKSYKSIVRLAKDGYTNLYWLRDGFPGWQEKGYTVE